MEFSKMKILSQFQICQTSKLIFCFDFFFFWRGFEMVGILKYIIYFVEDKKLLEIFIESLEKYLALLFKSGGTTHVTER